MDNLEDYMGYNEFSFASLHVLIVSVKLKEFEL